MKKGSADNLSIVDYPIPADVIRLILSYCEDSPQTMGRVALVCQFWRSITQPQLEKIKQIIFDDLSKDSLDLNIVVSPVFQRKMRYAVSIDRTRAYPLLQKIFEFCVWRADLYIDMGFGKLHEEQMGNMHKLILQEYPLAGFFNYVFWDLIYHDADFQGLLDCMSVFKALKFIVHDNAHPILALINSYHPRVTKEDTAFHVDNGVLFCGNRTVDSWIDELMIELTRDVQPGHFFRYSSCRIHSMALAKARQILQEIDIVLPDNGCCFQ